MHNRQQHSRSACCAVVVLAATFCFLPLAHAQSAAGVGASAASSLPAQLTPQACGSTANELGCPITNSVHFHRFVNAVFGWETLVGPPISALASQTLTSHAGYSSDGNGYAHHYGINLANNIEGKFFVRYAAPTIFRQDDAYRPVGSGHPFSSRLGHVFAHIFVTPSADDSHGEFNMSGIPSAIATALINNPQEPRQQRTVIKNVEAFGWNIGIFCAGDAWTEYKSSIMRLVPSHKRDSSAAGAS